MKLGIISDTHNMLREEVITKLKNCNYIFHAGDFCNLEILEILKEIGEVYAVRGNNDKGSWVHTLPIHLVVELEGYKIGMAHEKKDLPKDATHIDLMIYGHSHKYESYKEEDIQYINPGSCGRKRFSLPLSFVIVEVKGKEIYIEKIDL